MTPADPTKPPAYLKWWVCVLLLLASALNYMDRQTLSQTGVRVTAYLEMNDKQFARLESAFSVAFAVGVLAMGWLADRVNIRLMYAAIVVLWSLAGFATGFVESYEWLLACRFALGLFEAGNIPFGILTIKRLLRPEERALGNGMFQSGTALGAIITPMVVLACVTWVERAGSADPGFAWQFPFRVVGAVGLGWAVLWLVTIRGRYLALPPAAGPADTADTYWAIWTNRRFWVALVVVMAINTSWRSFGYWLPKMLQTGKGYTEAETAFLSSGFFIAADVGSVAVGAAILALSRRGLPLPRARLLCYAGCTGLTACSVVVAVLPRGLGQMAALFALGFGALGLFPIYYALSQEISNRHQGKVTATLSCLNALYLAALFWLQGDVIHASRAYDLALGAAGLFPLIGLVALAFFWRDRENEPGPAPRVPGG